MLELSNDNNDSRFIIYADKKIMYRISLSEIIMIEKIGHRILVHLDKNKNVCDNIFISENLYDLYNLIRYEGFEYINRSMIVNLNYVVSVSRQDVILKDGSVLELSTQRKATFVERIIVGK